VVTIFLVSINYCSIGVFTEFAFRFKQSSFSLDVSIISVKLILRPSVYMNIHTTYFYPEDGDSVNLRNVANTAHSQAIQRPYSKNINKNNYASVTRVGKGTKSFS
jgi:hypothetical protein